MLKEIKGYFAGEQVKEFVKEAERMIEEYGWHDRTVRPYNFNMPVTKIINDLKDYDICTEGSKEYLVTLANGLAEIMNSWENQHKEATIKAVILTGKHKGETRLFTPVLAKILLEDGMIAVV